MQLDETLTVEKAVRMARESKAVRKQQPQLRDGDMKEVEVMRRNPSRDSTSAYQNRSKRISTRNSSAHGLVNSSKPAQQSQQRETICTRCGRTIPLEDNSAQLDYPNALNVVRQDTFIVCVPIPLLPKVKCELEKWKGKV